MNKLILILLLVNSTAFAWTITADFEEGNVGDIAQEPVMDAFSRTAHESYIVNSPVLSGNQAGSSLARSGRTGFGDWGGAWYYPEILREGDEVWFRVNVYYPSGWDFSCGDCSQGMKFMRIHTASNGGSNQGYLDNLIKGTSSGGKITASSEVNGDEFKENNIVDGKDLRKNLGTDVQRNHWHTYEVYIKFSNIPGRGIHRIWQDGDLIFNDVLTATFRDSNSKSDFIYFYTYWNNGAPRTQTAYVDDVVITTDTPSRIDSNGYAFIGVGEHEGGTPPTQPPVDPVEPPSDGIPSTITDFTIDEQEGVNILADAYIAVSQFITSSKDYVFDFSAITTDTDGEAIDIKRYYLFDGEGNWIENIDYDQVPFVRTLPIGVHGFMIESESIDSIASAKSDVETVLVIDEPILPPVDPPIEPPVQPTVIFDIPEGATKGTITFE